VTQQFVTKDGKERVVVDYNPNDPDYEFAEITRAEKNPGDKRFKVVDSIAIPRELVEAVCKALKEPS
jgi:hypothetical protein